MSWITIIWSMIAAACLTLAAMPLRVWGHNRGAWVNLVHATTAARSVGVMRLDLRAAGSSPARLVPVAKTPVAAPRPLKLEEHQP